MTARITSVKPLDVEGKLPGEKNGPGVAMTVEITNGSAERIDLGTATVDLVDAGGGSVIQISSADESQLGGSLGAGDSVSATYVFSLPVEQRSNVQLFVNYSSSASAVVFSGSLPS